MPVDDPARPVDDAARRAAVSELRRAAEDGRLGPKELDARLARVQEARLAGELGSALDGLPPAGPIGTGSGTWPVEPSSATPPAAPRVQHPTMPLPAGFSPDDRLTMSAGWSAEKRSGRWDIPPYLRLQAGLSAVKMDCRQATPSSDVIDVEVGVGASNIVVVLPEGWGVNTDRLGKGIGNIKVKVPRAASAGSPTLVLHGQLGVGSLIVRHANWVERRMNDD